jgi:hypothetical protein
MVIAKYKLLAVFIFLVRVETSADPLPPNILEPKKEIIIIGRIKIQAFHKPNSKDGISDIVTHAKIKSLVLSLNHLCY